jgi:hypothetical protein
MKVLIATHETQGQRDNDFCFCEEGELIRFPVLKCTWGETDDECGCSRAMFGMKTRAGTTTIRVADLPISSEALQLEIIKSIEAGGWPTNSDDFIERVRKEAMWLIRVASEHDDGSVLELRHGIISERTQPDYRYGGKEKP